MDIEKIRELIRLMIDNDLSELDVRNGESQITLKRGPGGAFHHTLVPHPSEPAPAGNPTVPAGSPPATQAPVEEGLCEIASPMVGTFYASPDPDSPPFVTVGSRVGVGTTVCIIEAMKVFNEIKSEIAGTIEQILVKNEEAVEYGQPLFIVKAD